jgi:hypothetical protein
VALSRKNVCPGEQVPGVTVPVWDGLVLVAPEKSTFFVCIRKSTSVCAVNKPAREDTA